MIGLRKRTYTAGFDAHLPFDPRLQFRATYFNINYRDQVAVPDPTSGAEALANPDAYPDVLYTAHSVAAIETILKSTRNAFNVSGIDLSNPAIAAQQLASLPNFMIFDDRQRNLTGVRVEGVDADLQYTFATHWGEAQIGGRATYVSSYTEQDSPNAPIVNVDSTVLRPVDLRAQAYGGLRGDKFDVLMSVNFVDSYRNPYSLGGQQVGSWTTMDVRMAYNFSVAKVQGLRTVTLSVSVQNVFDADPPYVEGSGPFGLALRVPVGFDPANANPLGRVVSVGVSARW
jgi:iron complex outermembrane recepter protein